MSIVVEEYGPADVPEMLAIWNEVVADGLAFPQDQPETSESIGEFLRGQSYCGVARDTENNRILGLYILHPNNVGRCGHIANASYAVSAQARGMGLGARLVRDSLAQAKRLGFRIMQFNAVTTDNPAANRLYQSLGFQKLGTIPGGFRRSDNEYQDINLYFYTL